jgi:hypothetical protein
MAKMIQIPYGDIIVPKVTAQDVQKNIFNQSNEDAISLAALGLLVNLHSFPMEWELHKTELYQRYAYEGERAVKSAWKSLEQARYIIEFKYRKGKKYEYVYYYRMVPFTEEEKAEILANAEKEYGEIWGLQNEVPKLKTSKPSGKLNTYIKLNTLIKEEEEEEEKVSPSNLVSFLISKDITLDNALKFETRLLEEGLTGYTHEQVLDAIEWSLYRFVEGKCDEPYIYAVGRLQRVLDTKAKEFVNKPKKSSRKRNVIRTEKLPNWFDREENAEQIPVEPEQTQEEKKQEIEDMLKKLRSENESIQENRHIASRITSSDLEIFF